VSQIKAWRIFDLLVYFFSYICECRDAGQGNISYIKNLFLLFFQHYLDINRISFITFDTLHLLNLGDN